MLSINASALAMLESQHLIPYMTVVYGVLFIIHAINTHLHHTVVVVIAKILLSQSFHPYHKIQQEHLVPTLYKALKLLQWMDGWNSLFYFPGYMPGKRERGDGDIKVNCTEEYLTQLKYTYDYRVLCLQKLSKLLTFLSLLM